MAGSETEYWRRFVGCVIDRKYYLVELLGTGTASGVYRADHRIGRNTIREVAIKLMVCDNANEKQQLDALSVALDLSHPHLLRCHDAGIAELLQTNLLYLVMEKAEQSLYGYLRHNTPMPEEHRQIFLQIALGLNYLHTHARRYVHRDIKLGNVLHVDGVWKVADFGIIFEMRDSTTVMTDINWGTYKFMSPEACDHKITPAWDVWSLGVLMVYCLTREYPFRKTETKTLVESIRMEQPYFASPIPPYYEPIILGCLMKDYQRRWTSYQVVERLVSLQRGVPNEGRQKLWQDVASSSPAAHEYATVAAAPSPAPPVGKRRTVYGGGAELPGRKVSLKDGAEMILIPADPFQMGDADGHAGVCRTVTLSSYYIYKNLVTVKRYKQFCKATRRQMPPPPEFNRGWSKEDHPVVNVSWDDAQAYCDWAGVELPTEAQWEKAARGKGGGRYPWGEEFSLRRLQCSKENFGDVGGTASVGSFTAGASPYGVLDMAGNVWQWCADRYDVDFWVNCADDEVDPANLSGSEKESRVLRGGSWFFNNPSYFRCAYRNWNAPDLRVYDVGFRCIERAEAY